MSGTVDNTLLEAFVANGWRVGYRANGYADVFREGVLPGIEDRFNLSVSAANPHHARDVAAMLRHLERVAEAGRNAQAVLDAYANWQSSADSNDRGDA